jgi:carboxyl-terminal processing protease
MKKTNISTTIITAALAMLIAAGTDSRASATEPAAAAILDRYVAAIGGYDAWNRIENIRIVSETETFGITRRQTRTEETKSGRFHTRSAGPEGELEMGFDGTSVWRRAAWGRGILSENDPRGRVLRAWNERQLRNWRLHPSPFRLSAPEVVEGKEYLVVATTQPDEAGADTLVRHYFDPKTHLLGRTVRGNRDALQATTTYSDYRKVGDLRVPFLTISENPQARSVTKTIEWTTNVEVEPSLFIYEQQPDLSAIPELKGVDLSKARVFRSGDADLPPEIAKMIAERGAAQSGGSDGTTVVKVPTPAADAPADALKLETFNTVWNTINDTYWDPTFGGRDWKAIGDTYRPKVMAAADSKELHEVLNEMVNQLGQTHFRILGADKTRTLGSTRALPGTHGLSHRSIDGRLVVTNVEAGQPAEAAGIEAGWVITAVDGKRVSELQAELIEREPVLALRPEAALMRAAGTAMGGDAGGVVELELLDRQDRKVTKKLTRAERPLSSMNRVEFESRWLEEGSIGYVRLSSFFGDAAEQLAAALAEMRSADSIILDLRGNGGGAGDLAPTIAGMFAREKGSLGVSQLRHGVREFTYEPVASPFTGKLIILIDGGSASTSEVFAGGLQEAGRATVVGSLSRGAVLPSLAALLPTGGALQHVISDFRTPKGEVLEGRGVFPDIEVSISRADLIRGSDPVLERAVAVARE